MTADITLRGPGDVLAVLPYQLGYHPRDSVVVVSLHERQIGLVLRSDLPPDEHVALVSASLVGPVIRERSDSVLVVGFEEVEHASIPLLLAVVEGLEEMCVEVLDVQVVRDGRRYSPLCADSCCPPEGEPVPGPEEVPAVAEFVLQGRSPLSGRGQVDALVEPDPRQAQAVAKALTRRAARPGRVTDRRRRSARAWGVLLGEPGAPAATLAEEDPETRGPGARAPGARAPGARAPGANDPGARAPGANDPGACAPGPSVVADLASGLADVPWRDGVIAWLAPGVLPVGELDAHVVDRLCRTMPRWGDMGAGLVGEEVERRTGRRPPTDRARQLARAAERDELRQRLLLLCRAVPDSTPVEAAAVCTLTAAVCWSDGDGAVARAAVDRAIRLRPEYRLAVLLERVIDHGVRVGGARPRNRARDLGWTG